LDCPGRRIAGRLRRELDGLTYEAIIDFADRTGMPIKR
jgi:hypothetical protein